MLGYSTRRLKTLEILSITGATQQRQLPQSPLTESTHPTSGTNQGLVSPHDDTRCRHTFSTTTTPRVDTVDYNSINDVLWQVLQAQMGAGFRPSFHNYSGD